MRGDWLEREIDAFLARLAAADPDCDPAQLVEEIRSGYMASGRRNVLSSQAASRLYALASLALARRGSQKAVDLLKTAMSLSPSDSDYPAYYAALLERTRLAPARPVILVISCEKYAERSRERAERLRDLSGVETRIVVGRDARFPDDPRLLRVAADDSYEALPAKVAAAFVHVYETHAPGTTVLKLDDDVPVRDPSMLENALRAMTSRGVQYAGRRLEGPDLDRIWHWGKCSAPEVDARIYGGIHEGEWAGGTAYFLGSRALRWFALSCHRFPDLVRNAIYEDRLIGQIVALGGERLHATDLRTWGLDLPEDVETPSLDPNLWARLDRAWRQALTAARPAGER